MTHPVDPTAQYNAELQRVLESETFRHSDSLRRLLEYLGQRSLSDTNGLKEYTIGVEVFHKPQDYNPQEDPSVRVLVSKLRHKLDEYYGTEGAGNPARMDIPRGHFELRVHVRPVEEEDAPSESEDLRRQVRRWRWAAYALGACFVLLLVPAVFFRWGPAPENQGQTPQSVAWTPELETIWQPFLTGNHPPLIVLGTPMFTRLAGGFFRDPTINEWLEAQQSDQIKLLQKDMNSTYAVPSYSYTGVGEAMGAFILARLLFSQGYRPVIKRSNAVTWDDLRTNSVIFLGAPKFNRQVKDIPSEQGFVIDRGAIRNPNMRPGEPDAFRGTWSNDQENLLEDYALIHRLPGLHDHGEIMVLGSASTEATWAAVEYVTRPGYARDLVQKLKTAAGPMPRTFQVVIRVEFKQQVPWKISYVTHRILEPPWKSHK